MGYVCGARRGSVLMPTAFQRYAYCMQWYVTSSFITEWFLTAYILSQIKATLGNGATPLRVMPPLG